MLAAKTKVRAEMPDVANAPVENMGWLDQLIANARGKMEGGTTMALTHNGSGGSVALNPDAMAQVGQTDREDTIAHELTHVRQARRDFGDKNILQRAAQVFANLQESHLPYGQQPNELEAFQAEGDRAVRQGREPGVTPNFSTPGFREKGDIVLRESAQLLKGDDPAILAENVRMLIKAGYSPAEAVKRAQLNIPRK
jgi:hypothetical protein